MDQSIFVPQICRLLEEQVRETHTLNELLRQDRQELFTNLNREQQSEGYSRSVQCLCRFREQTEHLRLFVLSLSLVPVQG